MTMRKDIKAAWVEDLESGEHEQGRNVLVQKNEWDDNLSYCCLGRLCEVAKRFGFDIELIEDDGNYFYSYKGQTHHEILPKALWEDLGLTEGNPEVYDGEGSMDTLADLNDRGNNFADIAKIIKESDL